MSLRPLALAALALGAARAHAQSTPPATPATPPAADATCGTGDDSPAVAGWKLVTTEKFAFCLPPQWKVSRSSATLGSATLQWGTGEHPRERVAVVRVVRSTTSSMGGRVVTSDPVTPNDMETDRKPETIGGRQADVWRNRFNGRYATGGQWASPHVYITGEAMSAGDADMEIAIIRSVRFPTP